MDQRDGEEEKKKKVVLLVQEAIQELMEERKRRKQDSEGNNLQKQQEEEEEDLLLSNLLSKLDSLEKDADLIKEQPNSSQPSSKTENSEGAEELEIGELARDLSRIKRQNLITHCLLAAVIVMTAASQLGQVSVLLNLREKMSNPLKSVGELIMGSLRGEGKKPAIEAAVLPPVGVPDVRRSDMPLLMPNEED